ncbi:MAG: hypothetical protein ABI399_09210 [Bauldia sp.]
MRRLVVLSLAATLLGIAGAAADGKPPIRGLVSMGAYRFVAAGGEPVNNLRPLLAKPGIFGGIVIVASWRQLQPTAGAALADDTAIDEALRDVQAYNVSNPQRPLAVKLRVWGGFMAPPWAMSLGGLPIAVTHQGKSRLLGRFWTEEYRHAWADFQEMLAARYDEEPLIREVSVTSCMTVTAEPFFLPTEDTVQAPLRGTGLTDAAYRACLSDAVADYAPWQTTRIVLSVNPFRAAAGPAASDPAFTEAVMAACRQSIGARCVLDNHDLDAAPPAAILPIYAAMQRLGPAIEFQTFRETPDDFEGTIRKGIALGASAIELWQDFQGFPLVADETLKAWAALFPQ